MDRGEGAACHILLLAVADNATSRPLDRSSATADRRGAPRAVRREHGGGFWSADVSVWRRSRQFGEGAGGTEPSCRAVGWAARATGSSLWPGGDLGRRGCGGTSTGRPKRCASSAPCRGGSRAAPQSRRPDRGPWRGRRGTGRGGVSDQSVAVPSGAAGRARICLPSLGREGPQFRPTPGEPGDSEPGRFSSRGLPEGAGSAETWTAGGFAPEPAPSCHITPRVMSSREAERRGRPRARSDKAPYRTAESARDVTAGAGAALAGAAGPCPGGSAATGGTDALDAAWGGRS